MVKNFKKGNPAEFKFYLGKVIHKIWGNVYFVQSPGSYISLFLLLCFIKLLCHFLELLLRFIELLF